MPKATQLQMVYWKLKSDPRSKAGISETQAPGPRRHATSPSLAAGWPAGGSGWALSRKLACLAESLWPLAGTGQEEGGCPAALWVLSSCVQANPLTTVGPGEARPCLNCCAFTG